MSAQRGKDLLLKVDMDGLGAFQTVGGLRARSLSFNAQTVDMTHSESAGAWRELLAGAGIRSASLSGNGVFKDSTSDQTLLSYFFDSTIRTWQVIVPDFGTVEGLFQITALEYAGSHEDEMRFDMALESAGALTFTAA